MIFGPNNSLEISFDIVKFAGVILSSQEETGTKKGRAKKVEQKTSHAPALSFLHISSPYWIATPFINIHIMYMWDTLNGAKNKISNMQKSSVWKGLFIF